MANPIDTAQSYYFLVTYTISLTAVHILVCLGSCEAPEDSSKSKTWARLYKIGKEKTTA